MTDRKPVFIEKIMPVKLLNEQVYYENGGKPFKGLHRWYSRKPLAFSRASVLGSLLPADISMEEFEYLLGLDRVNENEAEKSDRHQRTRLYKTPPTPERVKRVQELCEQIRLLRCWMRLRVVGRYLLRRRGMGCGCLRLT